MSGAQNSITHDMLRPEIIEVPLHLDDRGTVYCIMDSLNEKGIKRTYVVRNWRPGLIRAWHGHKRAHTYLHVIKGASKICAMNIETGEHRIETLSGSKPQLFYVPPGWYNGTMTLQDDTRILVYSTLTFEQVKQDDFRKELTQEEVDTIWRVMHR